MQMVLQMKNTTDTSSLTDEIRAADDAVAKSSGYMPIELRTEDEQQKLAEQRNFLAYTTHIELGNYHAILNTYNSIFGEERVHLVDGQLIKTDPKTEFNLLLHFFDLSTNYLDFRHDREKGFHCLAKPVHYCLGVNKGVSQKTYTSIYDEFPELTVLQGAYSGEMYTTFKYIYKCNTKSVCCNITTVRFHWMQTYFC